LGLGYGCALYLLMVFLGLAIAAVNRRRVNR